MLAEINLQRLNLLRQLMRQRHGVGSEETRAVGLDCDGLDVSSVEKIWRLDFPEPATNLSLDEIFSLITKGS